MEEDIIREDALQDLGVDIFTNHSYSIPDSLVRYSDSYNSICKFIQDGLLEIVPVKDRDGRIWAYSLEMTQKARTEMRKV